MRRYYIDFINNKVVEDEQGYYVIHDDVEDIVAENEKLKAENERLKDAIKVMHTECDTCWKVQELRKENARLKAELEAKTMYAEARNDDAHMYAEEIRNMNENYELLEAENAKLKAENAKLKCLALHLFIRVSDQEYENWSRIRGHLKPNLKKRYRWWRIAKRCEEAYRKEKAKLKEGKYDEI